MLCLGSFKSSTPLVEFRANRWLKRTQRMPRRIKAATLQIPALPPKLHRQSNRFPQTHFHHTVGLVNELDQRVIRSRKGDPLSDDVSDPGNVNAHDRAFALTVIASQRVAMSASKVLCGRRRELQLDKPRLQKSAPDKQGGSLTPGDYKGGGRCVDPPGDGGDPDGPYASMAPHLARLGIVAFPCGGEDGKRPLIAGWQILKPARLNRQLRRLIRKFGSANVGISCGPSYLVVVDIDDPSLLDPMLARFGDTPLIVCTPSGGFHLYYKSGQVSVGSRNLRTSEGLEVDIKSTGGFVVAPPSINPKSGAHYTFYRGSFELIDRLPTFPAGTLPSRTRKPTGAIPCERYNGDKIAVGGRNDGLFLELLRIVPDFHDRDDLIAAARALNDSRTEVPLPDYEVCSCAAQAWKYQREGRNWVGGSPRTILTREEQFYFAEHRHGGDALLLWCYLEAQHAKRSSAFAVDREAMARDNVLPGWTAARYRKAIKVLRELCLLVLVEGGVRRSDKTLMPNKYLLRRPLVHSHQNATRTASPWGNDLETEDES